MSNGNEAKLSKVWKRIQNHVLFLQPVEWDSFSLYRKNKPG